MLINHTVEVSVILAVFNGERTLLQAIDSILKQTYRNFELIICNDASTDNTCKLLETIIDARVCVINNEKNLGPGPSRDEAIKLAKGFWLTFTDADDQWLPERLEVLMETAKQVGEAFIFDDIWECHDALNGVHPWRPVRGKKAFGSDGLTKTQVSLEELICSKRSLLKPIFPVSPVRMYQIKHNHRRYGEDMGFFLNLLALEELVIWYIPKPLYLYRITPGSASSNKDRYKLYTAVLQKSINLFPNSPAIKTALEKKIALIDHEERYFNFVWAIKSLKMTEAAILLWKNIWIIAEFLKRITFTIAYHAHRLVHGGRVRGTY